MELNEKDNDNLISNDNRWNNANGVWQLSTDYKINKKMRLSFNFLVDEFVIDKIERNNHKADGFSIFYLRSIILRRPRLEIMCLNQFLMCT